MDLPETAGSPKYLNDMGDPAFLLRWSPPGENPAERGAIVLSRYFCLVGVVRICSISTLVMLFFCSGVACADTPQMEQRVVVLTRNFELPQHLPERLRTVGLSDSGDLVVRYRTMTMTMAYNPPEEMQNSQDRLRLAQRQENTTLNGISLKLSFTF